MIDLRWAAKTDVGKVRAANEDSYLANGKLFAVADGLGGHTAGEVASRMAVTTLAETYVANNIDSLVTAVRSANAAILDRVDEDPDLHGMGTTVTLLGVVRHEDADYLGLVNVGDSRCYRLREGLLEQLTEDHSLVNELIRAGHITEDEAAVHPQRSVITRALGLEHSVPIDSWLVEPEVGDRFLLCSDGLTNEVPVELIASIMRRIGDPEELVSDLVAEANAARGADNITAVVVDVMALVPEPSDAAPARGGPSATDSGADPIDAPSVSGDAGSGSDADGARTEAGELAAAGAVEFAATGATNASATDDAARDSSGDKGPPPPSSPAPTPSPPSRSPGPRTSKWRVAAFALAAAGLIAAVLWIGRSYSNNLSLTANSDTHEIELVKGPRQDLPGMDHEVVKVYPVDARLLTPALQRQLDKGQHVADEAAADRWVNDAFERSGVTRTSLPPTTTTSATTSSLPSFSFPSPLTPQSNPFGSTLAPSNAAVPTPAVAPPST